MSHPIGLGAGITIEGDFTPMSDQIGSILDRLGRRDALFKRIALLMRRAFADQFAQGGIPPWQPLAASTLAAKARAGLPALTAKGNIPTRLMQRGNFGGVYSVLIASGKLRDSYVQSGAAGHLERIDAAAGTVEVGSQAKTSRGAPYAMFIQQGTRNMPARPVRLDINDIVKIHQALGDWLTGDQERAAA